MTSKILALLVVLGSSSTLAISQKLGRADFRVGALSVNQKVDSIFLFPRFGRPINIAQHIETHRTPSPETTYVYQFDSLEIGVDRFGIRWLEFTSLEMVTRRGIRVGDTDDKVKRLYGKPSGEEWLGSSDDPNNAIISYFKHDSTLGIAFHLRGKRVWKIVVGWGST